MESHKAYAPPRFVRHDGESDYPDWTRDVVRSVRQECESSDSAQGVVKPEFTTVVDGDRRYVEVSDSFCQLLGYRREELIGKLYDETSAPNTNDIMMVSRLFARQGYMHGLWMLSSRRDTRILVRYESWIRPDSYIEWRMEIVGVGY